MEMNADKLIWSAIVVALATISLTAVHTTFPGAMSKVSADTVAKLTSLTNETTQTNTSPSADKKTKETTAQKIWDTLSDGQTVTDPSYICPPFSYVDGLQQTIVSSINGIPSSNKGSSVLYTQDNSKNILYNYTYVVAKDGTMPTKLSDIDDSTSYSVGISFEKLIRADPTFPNQADMNFVNENLKLTGKELKNIASVTDTRDDLAGTICYQTIAVSIYGNDTISKSIANTSGLADRPANYIRLDTFINTAGRNSNPATILAIYSTYNPANSTDAKK